MIRKEIKLLDELAKYTDEVYAKFNAGLIPTIDQTRILGVRIPVLRQIAKNKAKELEAVGFLEDLPHQYHEEDLLHGIIVSNLQDFNQCVKKIDDFLPYIDNWAVCDTLSPKVLAKNRKKLLEKIKGWIDADAPYTVRFAISMLMQFFLEEDFCEEYLGVVAAVTAKDYYVKMMQAWYFATALAKQWQKAISYIEQKKLETWVHNKTIQKAVESRRISNEHKNYLRTLKK